MGFHKGAAPDVPSGDGETVAGNSQGISSFIH